MEVGLVIFVLFGLLVVTALYRYENPKNPRGKMTGRGGDFQDS